MGTVRLTDEFAQQLRDPLTSQGFLGRPESANDELDLPSPEPTNVRGATRTQPKCTRPVVPRPFWNEHKGLRAEASARRPLATVSWVFDMAQRLANPRIRSVIRSGVIPISALLVGMTSTTVGLLASAPQASARQTQVSVVSCGNVIASARKPDSDERIVLGSFGAPPHRIQRAANGRGNGWQYFAKTGVEVKAGSGPATVSIAPALRHRAAISWGNALPIVQTVRFTSCRETATHWDAYAGGFFLRSRTACVPLVVTVGSRSRTVRVGVGKSCR
jgi:hypothetical protein